MQCESSCSGVYVGTISTDEEFSTGSMGEVGINILPLCDFSWFVTFCPGVRIDPEKSRGWVELEVSDVLVLGSDRITRRRCDRGWGSVK